MVQRPRRAKSNDTVDILWWCLTREASCVAINQCAQTAPAVCRIMQTQCPLQLALSKVFAEASPHRNILRSRIKPIDLSLNPQFSARNRAQQRAPNKVYAAFVRSPSRSTFRPPMGARGCHYGQVRPRQN